MFKALLGKAGELVFDGVKWLAGGTVKWGLIGSTIGGLFSTVKKREDLTGENVVKNSVAAGKDLFGLAGTALQEVISPTPPKPRANQKDSAGGADHDTKQDAEGQEDNLSSKIMGIFNNFSGTKFGQAFAPVMNFLRSSPIISGILTVVFGMMALSGQNTMPMRLLAGGLALTTATQTGLLDSVTQGSGRNTPAVGGADSYYAPPRSQPHAGGPVSRGPERDPGEDLDQGYSSANQALTQKLTLG